MLSQYRGEFLTFISFFLWGITPLYFRQIGLHDANTIFAVRVLTSVPFLIAAIAVTYRGFPPLPKLKSIGWALAGAACISTSWYFNLWGSLNGQLLAVSLAFFLSPVMTMLAGLVFFQEKLSFKQWLSFWVCSGAFVMYCYASGELPWLTLVIGTAFALFSVVKRKGQISEIGGLAAEVSLMLPVSLFILAGGFGEITSNWSSDIFLLIIAPAYYLPLVLYGLGVRQVKQLVTAGLITYVEPIIKYILAITIFKESISDMQQLAMFIVWAGLLIPLPYQKLFNSRKAQPVANESHL